MTSNNHLKKSTLLYFVAIAFVGFAIAPLANAVNPPPDGGYPGFNTAEGQNALLSLTTGVANSAVGWFSLSSNSDGGFNTALGAGALLANTADQNTAVGAAALLLNTTGFGNTAVGVSALLNNITGLENTAIGLNALANNIEGDLNTATGHRALLSNTTGFGNTANGAFALVDNTEGTSNTAVGRGALTHNTEGVGNTAIGIGTLFDNTTGSNNTAAGKTAGEDITGSGNVCIGEGVLGDAGVNNTTWIRNVYDSVAVTRAVYVNQDNKIGTLASTRRLKDDIKPMNKASETIFALKPVTFRYKREIDRHRSPQFGLVAEEVAQVNPDLVTQDQNGTPYTVRYEAINAMLLNEFLKEHKKVEELEGAVASLTASVKEQAAQIQKVSTERAASRPAPQVVNNP
jgi:hypothetical protein